MCKRIIAYQVVEARSIEVLEGKIKTLMPLDWQPLGGVCVTYDESRRSPVRYAQALVKYKED